MWNPLRWFRNCQLFLAVGPDEKSVIYISEPASMFLCQLFWYFYFSKSSMKKLAITGESGISMATPSVCS